MHSRHFFNPFRNERGEISSWLLVVAFLALAAGLARPQITEFIDCQVQQIVSSGADGGGTSCGGGGVVDGPPPVGGPEYPEGPFGPGRPAPPPAEGAEGIPTSVQSCSAGLTVEGSVIGFEGDLTGQLEYIIETYPDGTQVVTFAGDGGVGAGTGPGGTGAFIGIGDSSIGAYADAGAGVTGLLGAGVQYELAPGETVQGLLADIFISTAAGPAAGVLDNILPGDFIPDPPVPDAVFGDITGIASAGAEAHAGIGILSLDAHVGGNVTTNNQYTLSADGVSHTFTLSGEFDAGASAGGGIPFIAWEQLGAGTSVQGAISIEYGFDFDGNPTEIIVTTSYSADGDVDVPFGEEDDTPTITTQQWTLDPNDPEIVAALEEVTSNPSLDGASEAWAAISDGVATTGPVEQEINTYSFPFAAGAGIGVLSVDVSGDVECVTIG